MLTGKKEPEHTFQSQRAIQQNKNDLNNVSRLLRKQNNFSKINLINTL